jgi:hypothetical protein
VGDFLVPEPYASTGGPYSGKVFAVLGPASGEAELADVAYAELVGRGRERDRGNDVAMADVDGDGQDDSIVASPLIDGGHVGWVSGDANGRDRPRRRGRNHHRRTAAGWISGPTSTRRTSTGTIARRS